MRSSRLRLLLLGIFGCGLFPTGAPADAPETRPGRGLMRVAAAQAKRRSVDWRIKEPAEVIGAVEKNLAELERLVLEAGRRKCDALALPEDTLGLLEWFGVNEQAAKEVLPRAVKRMIDRLGRAAADQRMYLVVCSDFIETDGAVYNTAFLLGRDGKEIGRYHKVCPTWFESGVRKRGRSFPVFPTPDLGTVGLAICYDLVIPETARCLALEGADVVFFPTMGTAAIGDDDIGVQALRVRAAENHVWLIVAHRGAGAMIISPRGKIVAQADGPDGLAVADIDPSGGREGGDSSNYQKDMRARLFRERNPEAFGILTNANPPALARFPIEITPEAGARLFARMLTVGAQAFREAEMLGRSGKKSEAIAAFEKLRAEYRGSWIDRASAERLEALRRILREGQGGSLPEAAKSGGNDDLVRGLAAKYPGDAGIEKDSRVILTENFETSIDDLTRNWSNVDHAQIMSLSDDRPGDSKGKRSLLMTHTGGTGTGGSLYRSIKPGYDKLHARFYVKFDPDCAPIHHFGTNIGGYNPSTPWPQGGAGERPAGDKTFTVGVEPHGGRWTWDYYSYWCEMRGSPPKGQTWGNSFIGNPALKVERGKWTCVEVMVKLNDLGDRNGELALWLDGRRVSHLGKGFPNGRWEFDKFIPGAGGDGIRWSDAKGGPEHFKVPEGGLPFDGFRWRTAQQLNLNYVWVYLYITQAPAGHTSRVWFDDIVVATDYIGPIEK